jgi:carbamoyltransferase
MHIYLGPQFSQKQIKRILLSEGLNFKEFNDEQLLYYVAEKLTKNKIIGWFQGRMEFGPRALGNRSILANPRNPEMKDILNSKISFFTFFTFFTKTLFIF